jgi:histidyl-tRNA synthetase
MKISRYKGGKDLLAADMAAFRLIESAFRESCLSWGYEEVRTPTIEYLHLFTSAGTLTPGMLRRVYSFLDWDGWSGERVALRPDGTIPAARLYIDNLQDQGLARLFYLINIFGYDETGREARERWQGGVELLGTPSKGGLGEVELIQLAMGILSKLRIGKVTVKLSHAGLIKAYLDELGANWGESSHLLEELLDGEEPALAAAACQPEVQRALSQLLRLKGKKYGFLKNLEASLQPVSSAFRDNLRDFVRVAEMLDALKLDYEIDIASGRGFEYYTGIIFQFLAGDVKIGGGGRYDELIPLLGGKKRSAAGFALYIGRLMDYVSPDVIGTAPGVLVQVASEKPAVVRRGFQAQRWIQEAGYVAEIDLGGRSRARSCPHRWKLLVRDQSPPFLLTDHDRDTLTGAASVAELLRLIRG